MRDPGYLKCSSHSVHAASYRSRLFIVRIERAGAVTPGAGAQRFALLLLRLSAQPTFATDKPLVAFAVPTWMSPDSWPPSSITTLP